MTQRAAIVDSAFRWLIAVMGVAFAGTILPIGTCSRVVVTYEDERPLLSSGAVVTAFAASLVPRLRHVTTELAARRRALPPPSSPRHVQLARVALTDAEAEVRALLADPELAKGLAGGIEELAPLRDYVAAAARTALAALDRREAALAHRRRPVPALARSADLDLRPAQQPTDGGNALDLFLGALSRLLSRVESEDLQTTFCAVSEPRGGQFHVYPASAADRIQRADAVEALIVWRGTYSYRVMIGNLEDTGTNLDLMSPQVLTLACSVEAESIACRERYTLAPGCGP